MARKIRPNQPDHEFGVITPTVGATTKEDWIGTQLKKVYDEALCEEIPDDMMQLLSALDETADADEKSRADEEPA